MNDPPRRCIHLSGTPSKNWGGIRDELKQYEGGFHYTEHSKKLCNSGYDNS